MTGKSQARSVGPLETMAKLPWGKFEPTGGLGEKTFVILPKEILGPLRSLPTPPFISLVGPPGRFSTLTGLLPFVYFFTLERPSCR